MRIGVCFRGIVSVLGVAWAALIPQVATAQAALPIRWLYSPIIQCRGLTYSPDGSMVAVVGGSYQLASVQLFNAATGAFIKCLPTRSNYYLSGAAFSPDSKELAVSGTGVVHNAYKGVVELWDVASGTRLKSFATVAGVCSTVAFSPDGSTVADGGHTTNNGVLELWNASTGASKMSVVESESYSVNSVAFEPNGASLAAGITTTGSSYGAIELWNVAGQTLTRTLPETGSHAVNTVAFSPDSSKVAGAYQGYATSFGEVWNASTGSSIETLTVPQVTDVQAVAFSPDGGTLALGGEISGFSLAGSLTTWSVSLGTMLNSLPTGDTVVAAVAFSPDGKKIADGGSVNFDNRLEFWKVSDSSLSASIDTATTTQLWSIAFSPNGTTLAEGGFNALGGALQIRKTSDGHLLKSLATSTSSVHGVAYSPDGKLLADVGVVNSAYATLEVWDVASGKRLYHVAYGSRFGAHAESVAFSPDGKTIAMAGSHLNGFGLIVLLDAATGTPRRTFEVSVGEATFSMAFSPDGGSIAAGTIESTDDFGQVQVGHLYEWNVATGKLLHNYPTGAKGVTKVAYSPDGKTLSDSGETGSMYHERSLVETWSTSTGRKISSFEPSSAETIQSLRYSPGGGVLLAGSGIGLRVLEARNLTPITTYTQYLGMGIMSIVFSPDRSMMAYASYVGGVVVTPNVFDSGRP